MPSRSASWTPTRRKWADYDTIRSEECVPLGHAVNANIALVAGFSIHHDAAEAQRRGIDGFQFFRYAVNALVANETRPGRSNLWGEYEALRGPDLPLLAAPGIGTPGDYRELVGQFQDAGVDQIVFLQQGGKNRHEHICESLETYASEVLPAFAEDRDARLARKADQLAPYIEAAMARKQYMKPLTDDEIPIVPPSRARAGVVLPQGLTAGGRDRTCMASLEGNIQPTEWPASINHQCRSESLSVVR